MDNVSWKDVIYGVICLFGGGGGLYGIQRAKGWAGKGAVDGKDGAPGIDGRDGRNGVNGGNGKSGWTKELHDEICGYKLQPLIDQLRQGNIKLESIEDKLDTILLKRIDGGS